MLVKRITSAAVLFLIGLILVLAGGWIFTSGIALFLGAAAWEYASMFEVGGFSGAKLSTTITAGLCALAAFFLEPIWFSGFFSLLIMVLILVQIRSHMKHIKNSGVDLAISLSALTFIGFLGSFLVRIRMLPDGLFWIIIAIAPAGFADIFGYLIGSGFGKRTMTPLISPGKTIEGLIAGIIGGTLGGGISAWIAQQFSVNIPIWQGILIGFTVSLACPVGDLAKSLVKRQFGLKDTGSAIPGHGGVLDRIDTWLIAAPIAYFLTRVL